MRIVNKKTFLELPAGTIYCKYGSIGCFGDLAIKEESLGKDWYYIDLINGWEGCENTEEFFDLMRKAEAGKEHFRNDLHTQSRDGLYEDGQLFAVYDRRDILQLILKLQATKNR